MGLVLLLGVEDREGGVSVVSTFAGRGVGEGRMVDWISKGKVTLCVVLVGGSVGFELDELIDGCNSLPLSEVEADKDPMVAGVEGVRSGSEGEVDVFSGGTNAEPVAELVGLFGAS